MREVPDAALAADADGSSTAQRRLWWSLIAAIGVLAAVAMTWCVWAVASPGSRHPVVLTGAAIAVAIVSLLLLSIGGDLIWRRTKIPVRPRAQRVAVVVLLGSLVMAGIGSTDLVVKIRLRQSEDQLREAATAALEQPSARAGAGSYKGFGDCEPRAYRDHAVDFFAWQGCPSVNPSGQVFFWSWGSPTFLDGPSPYGLAFSPSGAPLRVGPEACVNDLGSGWYEIWTPRGDDSSPCPFGLSRP